MDLLKTILVYLTLVFVSSVQSAPAPTVTPPPTPTLVVETATPAPSYTPVPTPDITPNKAYKTLQVGDRGANVEAMQLRLKELGYYTGDVDGAFGNQTRQAVERFQYQHGLSVDGIAGKRTLTVLYESPDVVAMPTVEGATATPEQTAIPTRTPVPTQTPIPTYTPVPTESPAPDATAEIAETAEPSADAALASASQTPPPALQGFALQMEDTLRFEGVALTYTPSGAKEAEPVRPGKDELGLWYAPALLVLEQAQVTVIPDQNASKREYGFAYGESLYRISYTLDAEGQPGTVYAYRNEKPVELTSPVARVEGELLYLPVQTLTELLGFTAEYNESSHILAVLPKAAE